MITGQVPDKYPYLNFLWSGVGISTSESVGFGLDDFWGDEADITTSESGTALDDVSDKGVGTSIAESVAEMDVSGKKVGISISSSVGRLGASSSSET